MAIRKPLIVGAMIAALLTGGTGLANAAGSAPAGHGHNQSVPSGHEWIGSAPTGHHHNDSAPTGCAGTGSAPTGHSWHNTTPEGHHGTGSVPTGQHEGG
jgi:hypothetical protein